MAYNGVVLLALVALLLVGSTRAQSLSPSPATSPSKSPPASTVRPPAAALSPSKSTPTAAAPSPRAVDSPPSPPSSTPSESPSGITPSSISLTPSLAPAPAENSAALNRASVAGFVAACLLGAVLVF